MTVNRVLKRLVRDLHITAIPQPRDCQYLYMPNPTIIHPRSRSREHFLAIADFYIAAECPSTFIVEPDLKCDYRPDIYYRDQEGTSYVVEVQLSKVSNKVMQEKYDKFVTSYRQKKHDAKMILIVSDREYKIQEMEGYIVRTIPYETVKKASEIS